MDLIRLRQLNVELARLITPLIGQHTIPSIPEIWVSLGEKSGFAQ
jgi:hypothetical protein